MLRLYVCMGRVCRAAGRERKAQKQKCIKLDFGTGNIGMDCSLRGALESPARCIFGGLNRKSLMPVQAFRIDLLDSRKEPPKVLKQGCDRSQAQEVKLNQQISQETRQLLSTTKALLCSAQDQSPGPEPHVLNRCLLNFYFEYKITVAQMSFGLPSFFI